MVVWQLIISSEVSEEKDNKNNEEWKEKQKKGVNVKCKRFIFVLVHVVINDTREHNLTRDEKMNNERYCSCF